MTRVNVGYAIVLFAGAFLGGISAMVLFGRWLSVHHLTLRSVTLVDAAGNKWAELKTEAERTYLVFLDGSGRPRLTLNLDGDGPTIVLQGVEPVNKIGFSVNNPLRTASIYASALTSGINVVGTEEARVKLSDSVTTDARSASLSIWPRVTKLRLASDGAESQLWTSNEYTRGAGQKPTSVQLDIRTRDNSCTLFRLNSKEKPEFSEGKMFESNYNGAPSPPFAGDLQ